MPIVNHGTLDWAKEVEDYEKEAEALREEEQLGKEFKKIIEYKIENDKKYKITNTFKIDRIKLPKSVAERKRLKKFGDAWNDPPGVNPATTLIGDEIFMEFINKKQTDTETELQAAQSVKIQCRICKGDHWTSHCPLKDVYEKYGHLGQDIAPSVSGSNVYKPPNLRAVSPTTLSRTRPSYQQQQQQKDEYTLRVTNLSEETTESDLMDLFRPFGTITRVYLAKDRYTQVSRGFAFVTFQREEDAKRAILSVNNYGYHHLILKVEFAKPSRDL